MAQVPLPPVDERKKVVEDVDKDRRYAIDAAIVRTMKSRKVLQHQQVCIGQPQAKRMERVQDGSLSAQRWTTMKHSIKQHVVNAC